ncbi:restriction endonuclease subunit S [Chryseobacterium sp. SG20098]|uniref:restriction endonuclease subunit S n=1 Tax=Chryseobacterium sp. SG20098 TaxID=3074145 RepID=UPI0025827288|nr:restriction endonuclease subunit S [Chryseobacterium sp. SG20098]WNI38327.1 restriction endonuclease subunit S [Chryseobacterium sp. SG20098]
MQRYEKYKDSGVDWIGEIPEHWKVLPGLNFIYENKAKNKGMIRNTVLSLSYGKIRVKAESELTGLVPESFETYQLVNVGDVIFRPTDLQNDMVSLRSSISEFEGIITSAYLNLRFKENADPKFFHYFFRSIDNNKIIYGLGSGLRQNISYLDFRRFNFPFPPLEEQQTIAIFLDDKTSKIDQTIAIKEKEIELLKERRQILIQKAVTKGLDDEVKMKDSGLDWIGEIPEHWEVRKLKYCLNIKNGQDYKHVETESGYPVIGSGGQFAYASKYLYDGEAILLGRKGTIDKPQHIIGKFWTVDTMFYSIPKKKFLGKFLFYCCQCIPFSFYSTATALPSMTQKDLNNHPISIPQLEEQIRIVSHLEEIEEKIAKAILLKQQEIEKLKEYKTVLIDNVVTGKVRVN